jgi:hypothetical protein
MSWTRRGVLRGLLGSAAVASAGYSNTARASTLTPFTLPSANGQSFKILEIFQAGGASHRETFWAENPEALPTWKALSGVDWANDIGFDYSGPLPNPNFTLNMNCAVRLGPACHPIQGHDLYKRMRLIPVTHHIGAHRPAAYLGLTGLPMGRTRASGLGAAIQRHYGGPGTLASYVIDAADNFANYPMYAAASGIHGSQHRPLIIPVRTNTQMMSLLDRQNTTGAQDDLLDYYNTRYGQRLTYPGGHVGRSDGYATYRAAIDRALSSQTLKNTLQGTPLGNNPLTGFNGNSLAYGRTHRAISLAAHLLDSPGVRHVCVVERGRFNYDSHQGNYTDPDGLIRHATHQSGNAWSIMRALAELVDSGVLDLSNTLIWIRSEFGRTRNVGTQLGTNHWHRGQPNVLIGLNERDVRGYIRFPSNTYTAMTTAGCATGPVGGALTDGGYAEQPNGSALSNIRPTDVSAGVYMAAGLDPFHTDCFLPSETSVVPGTLAGAARTDIADALFGAAYNNTWGQQSQTQGSL